MKSNRNDIEGRPSAPCSPSSTPETDSQTRHSWGWDTRKMDYRPGGIVVDADLARKLERERDDARLLAAYWRDVATGTFSKSANLPWEISPENARTEGPPTETSDNTKK